MLKDIHDQMINKSEPTATLIERRSELQRLDMLALKANVLLERVSYYTMDGQIFPRDNKLKAIPFFESEGFSNENKPQHDLQSCLKAISVFRHLIERLEAIEIPREKKF